MSSVRITDVSKSYGNVPVIHGISVDIQDGEFVVLVGPSGCGKSTLLRMIAGLEDITGGHIAIDQTVVNDLLAKQRDIAMVFQSYALYPHLTVAQNMGFSLSIKKVDKDVARKRVDGAAEMLGLTPLMDRFPRQLSGGQRQRVAMGRAIVRDPKVFLFDEPLSNLDAKLRVQMRAEIKDLHRRLQATMIYVTHDQIEAMTMADKIVIMKDGVIEQVGRPLDLYDHPNSLFVAQFIGSPSMNIVSGYGKQGGLKLGSGEVISLPIAEQHHGAHLHVGIRPEHIVLSDEGIEATARNIEQTGAETVVTAEAHGEIITFVSRERLSVSPGEKIKLRVLTDRIHLFDGATTKRI